MIWCIKTYIIAYVKTEKKVIDAYFRFHDDNNMDVQIFLQSSKRYADHLGKYINVKHSSHFVGLKMP